MNANNYQRQLAARSMWPHRRDWVLMIILCPMFCFQSSALGEPDSTSGNPIFNVAEEISGDLVHIATAPLRMNRQSAGKLLYFTMLNAGFMYGVDNRAHEEFALQSNQTLLQPARALVRLGEAYDNLGIRNIAYGLSGLMLAGGLIGNDKKMLHTSRLLVESWLISGAIVYWSKRFFGRSRPYAGLGPHQYSPFEFSSSDHSIRSFPSGHSSSAWALMTVIAKQYSQWWIKYPAYAVAASVSLQRMEDRQHWLSDVVVGGAIGHWVATSLVSRFQSRHGVSMTPYVAGQQIGINVRF